MFPILSYGANLFSPTKGLLGKMDVHWRQVQRWVTNCFRSTPIPILAAELCLPPLCVLLTHKRRMAALRLISSPPTINPASARLSRTFPSLLEARARDSHRALCTRLLSNVMPLHWKTPLPSPPVRTNLPVDALAHLTLPLLDGLSYAPLIGSTLLSDLPSLSSDTIMVGAYRALRRKARSLMMDHWRSLSLPDYYSFPLRFAPHPFMGLGKFIASRIHQMRAQKSYLAAHPSWFNASDSQLCPLCGDEPESSVTPYYAVPPRPQLGHTISEVSPQSTLTPHFGPLPPPYLHSRPTSRLRAWLSLLTWLVLTPLSGLDAVSPLSCRHRPSRPACFLPAPPFLRFFFLSWWFFFFFTFYSGTVV